MLYQLGQHVNAKGCKGTIIRVHQLGEIFLYEVRADCNVKKIITVCAEEIKLLVA